MTILFISIAIVILILLFFRLILNKQESTKYIMSSEVDLDPNLKKVVDLLGGDISSLLPEDLLRKQIKDKSLEKLLNNSGNPWNVTTSEFVIIRFVLLGVSILGAILFSSVLALLTNNILLSIPILILIPLYAYYYPTTYLENIIKKRELEFKANLPEAIDYLTMAISGGGYSLTSAFEETLKYLPKGAVKDEFQHIVTDIQTGKTMEVALNDFAERVPTESIKAFAKALNNANKLSVNVVDILRARAKASRKELELEIEKRVTTLPTRVMLVLSPTSALSIILIAIAPSIVAIMKML